jgi:hypothetical protein
MFYMMHLSGFGLLRAFFRAGLVLSLPGCALSRGEQPPTTIDRFLPSPLRICDSYPTLFNRETAVACQPAFPAYFAPGFYQTPLFS